MGSETWHEPFDKLTVATQELHRAFVSVVEELQAVDWYQQRIDATTDGELKAILEHNRDEEKEHASMVLEWIRRRDPTFRAALETYLFTEGDVTKIEAAVEKAKGAAEAAPAGSEPPASAAAVLTVGSLKEG